MTAQTLSGANATSVSVDGRHALRADLAASFFGVSGLGIKVGVLSDSFNALGGAAADEASGALPSAGNLEILKDDQRGTDEGRALAELIHSVAPLAQISFYSGSRSEGDAAAGVAALRDAGAQIICDDLTFFAEPFYQLGDPIERAIHAFTAAGGIYLTPASNAGPQSFYEDSWRPGNTNLPGIGPVSAMNFGTPRAPNFLEPLYLTAGLRTTLDLQTDQPWQSIDGTAPAYSLAFAVYDPNGQLVSSAKLDMRAGDPVQIASFTPAVNGTYSVAIFRNGGKDPGDLFKIVANNDGAPAAGFANSAGSGSEIGHNADPYAITVGAGSYQDTPAYGRAPAAEPFSAAGPGQLRRGPEGLGFAAPVELAKTNIDGVDGQETTLPSSTGLSPFFGTSAAVASVAGVVALMKQENPSLNGASAKRLLQQSAAASSSPPTQSGAGLVQADYAVSLAAAANPTPSGPAASVSAVQRDPIAGALAAAPGGTAHMTDIVNQDAGSHILAVLANGGTLHSIRDDVATGSGPSAPRVLTPGFGWETVGSVVDARPTYDTARLAWSDFGSVADGLQTTAGEAASRTSADFAGDRNTMHLFG